MQEKIKYIFHKYNSLNILFEIKPFSFYNECFLEELRMLMNVSNLRNKKDDDIIVGLNVIKGMCTVL